MAVVIVMVKEAAMLQEAKGRCSRINGQQENRV
jgi:hypothetical protein